MVIMVELHMFRVFLTGSYKKPREFNWVVGVLLLVLTLLLSFTGYLLPDDQLGFWAVTVGTNMARATPLLGHDGPFGPQLGMTPFNDVRFGLLGGSIVDSNALLRAYIWHCVAIPIIAQPVHGRALLARAQRRRHLGSGADDAGIAKSRSREEGLAREPMDLHQLWTILSTPDNVPIVLLLFVVPFYTWYGLRQAFANDRLIAQLEADPEMAKTHHRKTQPWKPGWASEVHVWPYLLRIEFLAAIIVTVILMVWSITLNAPLEEPANPTLTMNPSKAPWYFLGLQEMLVYFDPWIAGVVMPSLIIVGLMVIPYIDANPLGNGYYTYKQRKFAILDVYLRIHRAVGVDDRHRHADSRSGLDVVLAGHDVGSQPADLRGQPRPAGYLRHPHARAEDHFRRHRGGRRTAWPPAIGMHKLITLHAVQPQDLRAHERAAVRHHADLPGHHAVAAGEDSAPAGVPHQVRLGHALVQRMSDPYRP